MEFNQRTIQKDERIEDVYEFRDYRVRYVKRINEDTMLSRDWIKLASETSLVTEEAVYVERLNFNGARGNLVVLRVNKKVVDGGQHHHMK